MLLGDKLEFLLVRKWCWRQAEWVRLAVLLYVLLIWAHLLLRIFFLSFSIFSIFQTLPWVSTIPEYWEEKLTQQSWNPASIFYVQPTDLKSVWSFCTMFSTTRHYIHLLIKNDWLYDWLFVALMIVCHSYLNKLHHYCEYCIWMNPWPVILNSLCK